MADSVDVRLSGSVARVVMHRGGNNAIAPDLMQELAGAFTALGADVEVRAVVLESAYERYFSVGADLSEMGSLDREAPDAEEQVLRLLARSAAGFAAIATCPKPVIARLSGHALGGGCELALCCDYRIMVQDGRSRIGQTEAALGIMPGAGGSQRLPRLIGRARALPLLFEARRLSAVEAEAIGLVNQAVPTEELEQAVRELAERLARSPTLALGLIKQSLNEGEDLPLAAALELEARNFARAALSQDALIGIVSFFQKQEPEFTGR
ncbi:MAG: enoyl-CoA hydratase/isomerase family protein [Candidatus Dormibacteraeota bacterium]|uniref:Enoyl-CoA hydratase/isomerase family protein n=1 Tax=Candidatus Dormiibacter inghamiae TaxID=3127013 RepID=A0A934KAQ9_9BACT|nr:enoyl-CoA hydratase/isomerase family protein [Candidatus Dormibacteraeota bacterium]MBJ7607275.1 enoyl-CoA hydratase/isomerase family protein [Candidatus Dormibacteraeota bacterium]